MLQGNLGVAVAHHPGNDVDWRVAGEWLRGADFVDDRAAKVTCVSLSELTW